MHMYFSDEYILCKLQSSNAESAKGKGSILSIIGTPFDVVGIHFCDLLLLHCQGAQSKAPRAFPLSKSKFRESRIEFCSSHIPRSLADLILTTWVPNLSMIPSIMVFCKRPRKILMAIISDPYIIRLTPVIKVPLRQNSEAREEELKERVDFGHSGGSREGGVAAKRAKREETREERRKANNEWGKKEGNMTNHHPLGLPL